MPKFTVFVLLLAVAMKPVPAQAFTVAEAQTCGDTLLTAYNNKTYPKKLLAVEKIVRKAFGANYRALSKGEITLVLSVSEEYLRTSFTEPTGKFQYRDLVVESVEVTTGEPGFRVLGEVTVKSPKGNGRYSFLALVTSEGCRVFQVRIADVMTLVDALKASLSYDRRLKNIYKD